MPFFTYILESEKSGKLYFGQTQNLEGRIKYHNTGKSRYTRKFLPWKVIAYRISESRSEAMKYEKMLKDLHSRSRVAEFINRHGFQLITEFTRSDHTI